MRRPVFLLLCLLAAACGEADGPAEPPPDAPPTPAAPGPFTLSVETPGEPGRRPGVTIGGDPTGVTVTVTRLSRPRVHIRHLAGPERPVPGGLPGEEVGACDAGSTRSLPPLGPGLHLVEARRGEVARRALLPVSDLAVLALRSPDFLLVFVVDPATGRTVPRAEVFVEEGGATRGTTDATGIFRVRLEPARPAAIYVRSGERCGFAVAGAVEPAPERLLSPLVADREVARGGDEIRFALLRGVGGGLRPERFALATADGLLLAEGPCGADETVFSLRVPEEAPPGPATLTVVGEEGSASRTIRLTDAPTPSVRLSVDAPSEAVVGETVPVAISGRLEVGGRAAGAPVAYRAWPEGRPAVPALEGRGRLDAGGRLRTSFVPNEPGPFFLEATAPDPLAGTDRVRRRIDVRSGPLELDLRPERRWIRLGEPLRVRVLARFAGDSREISGEVAIGDDARPFRLAGGEPAVLELEAPGAGVVTVRARTTPDGPDDPVATAECRVRVVDEGRSGFSDGIVVVPDRDSYLPGDRAEVLVLLPFALEGLPILTTVLGDRMGSHAVETAAGDVHVFETRIPRGMSDRARFLVAAAGPGGIRTAEATAEVGEDPDRLRAHVEFLREGGRPGMRLRVTKGAGRGRAARGVAIVRDGEVPVAFLTDLEIPAEGAFVPLPDLPALDGLRTTVAFVPEDGSFRVEEETEGPPPPSETFELRLPPFLVEGDVAVLRVVAGRAGADSVSGRLEFASDGLLAVGPAESSVELPPGGETAEFEGTFSARRPGPVRVRARLETEDGVLSAEGGLTVLSRARFEEVTAAGRIEGGSGTVWVNVPRDFRPDDSGMRIHLSAHPPGAAAFAAELVSRDPGDAEDALARGLLIEELRLPSLVALATRQREDGGWGRGPGGGSDPAATARLLEALAEAEGRGVTVSGPDLERAAARLRAALAGGLADSDPDAAARAVAALAALGDVPETARELAAERLAPGAAAALVRALARPEDRPFVAGVVSDLLRSERELSGGRSAWGEEGAWGFEREPVCATAAVLRTFVGREGAGVAAERAIRFLLEAREGPGWGSPRRTAEAVRALDRAARAPEPGSGERIIVRIRADDAIVASLSGEDGGPPGWRDTAVVPGRYLSGGRVRIAFEAAGDVPVDWTLRLRAAVPAEEFAAEERGLRVHRTTRAVRHAGDSLELAVLGEGVRRGERLITTVQVSSPTSRRRVLVRVPVAAGTVPTPGDPGGIDPALAVPDGVRATRTDREVIFFVPEVGPDGVGLSFLSRATVPGRFTVLPARARLADDPLVHGASASEILYVE